MDQVSEAVPEMVWLTRVNARGTNVTVNGKAFNTNAVANFIDNLDSVDGFAEPVLRQTNRSRQRSQAGAVYDFVVSFSFDPAKMSVRQEDEEEQPPADEAAG
jgi:Tfp pilus assembly protein PilN